MAPKVTQTPLQLSQVPAVMGEPGGGIGGDGASASRIGSGGPCGGDGKGAGWHAPVTEVMMRFMSEDGHWTHQGENKGRVCVCSLHFEGP